MCIYSKKKKIDADGIKNEKIIDINGICRINILSPWFVLDGIQFNERLANFYKEKNLKL